MTDNFCVMPFYGGEYSINNTFTPCCLLAKNHNIDLVRQDILRNIKTPACNKCWSLESKGITSDRQLKNQSFDYFTDTPIEDIKQQCIQGNYSQQIVKLYTSNHCNSTCITCNGNFSSAWMSLENKKVVKRIVDKNAINDIDWENIKMLTLVGGEPLYEKLNFDILQKLINSNNTNCFISITTNGSVKLTNYQINILKQFSNLNFCLSIDGIEKTFEYIRYPITWEQLLNNINLYKSLGIQLSVSFTISNLNILEYDKITNWFDQQGLKYNHNLVTNPDYFNLNSLPKEVKNSNSLFGTHTALHDINFKKFKQEISRQDKLKNISISDYIPYLNSIIQFM